MDKFINRFGAVAFWSLCIAAFLTSLFAELWQWYWEDGS